jgi:hypothetical protein
MPIFRPQPHHKYVGQVKSYTHMNVEHDESLYVDTTPTRKKFFIVEATESAIPPNPNANFEIRHLTMIEVRKLLKQKPELRESAQPYL